MKNRIVLLLGIFLSLQAAANNMLVQNVTTTGNNAAAKTIQVQFDMSWDNSWRDGINWDAAWIFIKFKDANGLWQHAQLNQTGFANGSGTANTMKVTSDKVGCWAYRSALGSGTFNATGMQLQWNYGLSGLNDVTGLEVRVFSTEMVYVPEGEFNCARTFYGDWSYPQYSFNVPGANFPVINSRLSPSLSYNDGMASTLRIKGDGGIDSDNDGTIDNTSYPLGYRAFYCYKYEITEQQYADFLNTLTANQITTLGVAGSAITLTNGQYFSSTPNTACIGGVAGALSAVVIIRLLAYADWAALRPMSFTEVNKVSYGPLQPVNNLTVCCSGSQFVAWGSTTRPNNFPGYGTSGTTEINDVGYTTNSTSDRSTSGASYFGALNLTGNGRELVVKLNYLNFTNQNGNGILGTDGNHDISSWSASTSMITSYEQASHNNRNQFVFRYCRSAE